MRRKLILTILTVSALFIAVLIVFPNFAGRAYNGVRWRFRAATGLSLPNLRPVAPPAVSERPNGLVGAPVQREQEQEEDRLLGSLPGHYPGDATQREKDGGYVPVRPEMLSPLPQPFQTRLVSMHQRQPQKGLDGATYPLSFAGIVPEDGLYIFELCRKLRPQRTLEIGFAEGYSTMYFLAAAKANGTGSHVAVDPFEKRDWHSLGLQKVKEAGMEGSFRFMESLSISALPTLASEGLKFDVVFIDGDHRFDTQLADFLLSDAIVQKGGYILLHDVWMASTRKLMSFIERNRGNYKRHPVNADIAAYEKVGDDRRDWRHFIQF